MFRLVAGYTFKNFSCLSFFELISFTEWFYMCMNQVTNPAIDPLREGLVMSLEVNLGKRGNILEVGPENASQVAFP